MGRWRSLLVFLLFVYLGCLVVDARKMVVFRRGGGAMQGPFTLKVFEFQNKPEKAVRHLFGHQEAFPLFLRTLPFIEKLHMPLAKGVPQSFICNTCMDISTFAEQVLADPETMNDVLEYINGSLCDVMPGLKEECASLAETYVPEIVEMLQVYAAPDKLCGETKLCPSSSMLALDDGHTCKMCTNFATQALTYLKDNKTESEILDALHSECSKLGDFHARCDMLVSTYAPLYMKELESAKPEQVCEKIGFCMPVSLKDTNHCAACEFAVFEIKAKLRNPAVQEKMLEMLLDECTKVPSHVDECKVIITQYGPLFLANIDHFVDADTICTKIHACDATSKVTSDSVDAMIQLPVAHQRLAKQ